MQTCFEKRHALVIGNSAYQGTAALRNPANDARDIANTLAILGTYHERAYRQHIDYIHYSQTGLCQTNN
ncbi:caspase family protein [Candidatus Parabeggiatoa sp. HSG14]|uniref:caspase family protein n=1 Tax=Candidatus Parabeggiatoa sp. HSG14 TaxID=3055593 RepID=UPI0025A914CF|nr:caspase family protein [Thiotrichales bacterium HSG14]